MPDPESETYRVEVQTRVQSLPSGHRERNPALEQMSTGRLILEGVVEELKIYRLHKQDQTKRTKGKDMGRDNPGRRENRKGNGESSGRKREDRGSRSKEERDSDRRGLLERSRDISSDADREYERQRRRESGQYKRDISNPVAGSSSSQGPDSEYMMAGGAGPSGTSPFPDHDPSSRSNSTQAQHHIEHPEASDRNLRAAEDVGTPKNLAGEGTGDLPKYKFKIGPALGFGDHFMSTYQHIKAEHDAGKREKGMFEKFLENKANKSADAGAKAVKDKKVRFEDGEEKKKSTSKGKGRAEEKDGKAHTHVEQDDKNNLRVVWGKDAAGSSSRHDARKPGSQRQYRREHSPSFVYDRAPHKPLSDHRQLDGHAHEPRTSSTLIPHGRHPPTARKPHSILKKDPPVPNPPRDPPRTQPPPPPAAAPRAPSIAPSITPSVAPSTMSQASNLLNEIAKGVSLRKVRKTQHKPTYEQNSHSHDVEEREQAQAHAETAAQEEHSDAESDWDSDRAPDRTFRQQLGSVLEQRSNDSGLHGSGENVMGSLAADVAAPTWDWSNLDRSRGAK